MAVNSADYRKAHQLMRDENEPTGGNMTFPTLLALEGDRVIGILGTHIYGGVIYAGPLVLRKDRVRLQTSVLLIDVYDGVMRKSGVQEYFFSVPESNPRFLRSIEKVGDPRIEYYSTEEGHHFFRKRI